MTRESKIHQSKHDRGDIALVITCEHGGNTIPPPWKQYFLDAQATLQSHRGYDPGALELARRFARSLDAPLLYSIVSRLLVELNRSPGHPRQFSEFTRNLPGEDKQVLIERYYEPYRQQAREEVRRALARAGRVLHLSVHSFTPVWEGVERPIDVGYLYDPRREAERRFCTRWLESLKGLNPSLRLRRNAPYRGTADALVTAFRREFPHPNYWGIELEVNQRYPLSFPGEWKQLQHDLIHSLPQALGFSS